MKAFLHHLAYDFKTGIRDRSKLLMFYLFPLVFFALVGGLMTTVNPYFKDTMLPAMILFAIMSSALLSMPGILLNARENGVLRSFRINGVPAASIISIPVISAAVHMAVVSVVIAVAGARLFGGVAPTSAAGFAGAALLSYLAYAGIGVLIGVAAGNSTVATLVGQLIYIPSIILGGLMVPDSIFPAGFKRISLLLPASHGMRVFQALGLPGDATSFPWLSIAVLAATVIAGFGLSALIFEWDSRASVPSRKSWAALLLIAPFVLAAVVGA